MKITLKRIIIAVITFTVGLSVWGIWFFSASTRGRAFAAWEGANTNFKIRITAYKEMAAFTPGAYYVLQSASVRSNEWQEIITIKTDEAHPIPREQARFVSDNTAYIFMGRYYAVTTNSGRSWSVWDAERDLSYEQFNIWPAIKEIYFEPDGSGRMLLYPFSDQHKVVPNLYTTDYGQHWHMK